MKEVESLNQRIINTVLLLSAEGDIKLAKDMFLNRSGGVARLLVGRDLMTHIVYNVILKLYIERVLEQSFDSLTAEQWAKVYMEAGRYLDKTVCVRELDA